MVIEGCICKVLDPHSPEYGLVDGVFWPVLPQQAPCIDIVLDL